MYARRALTVSWAQNNERMNLNATLGKGRKRVVVYSTYGDLSENFELLRATSMKLSTLVLRVYAREVIQRAVTTSVYHHNVKEGGRGILFRNTTRRV